MPRYLRYTVAITSSVTAYFAYSILTLGIATATGHETLTKGLAALIGLGSFLVMLLVAMGVSDWIRTRYPTEGAPVSVERESVDR